MRNILDQSHKNDKSHWFTQQIFNNFPISLLTNPAASWLFLPIFINKLGWHLKTIGAALDEDKISKCLLRFQMLTMWIILNNACRGILQTGRKWDLLQCFSIFQEACLVGLWLLFPIFFAWMIIDRDLYSPGGFSFDWCGFDYYFSYFCLNYSGSGGALFWNVWWWLCFVCILASILL